MSARDWMFGTPQMVCQSTFLLVAFVGALLIGLDRTNPHAQARRKYFLQLLAVSGISVLMLAFTHHYDGIRNSALGGSEVIFRLVFGLVVLFSFPGFAGAGYVLAVLGTRKLVKELRWQGPEES